MAIPLEWSLNFCSLFFFSLLQPLPSKLLPILDSAFLSSWTNQPGSGEQINCGSAPWTAASVLSAKHFFHTHALPPWWSSHCSLKHTNYVVLSAILPVSWICPENLLPVTSKGIRPLQKSVSTCLLFIPHLFQEVFYTIPASTDPSHTLSFIIFIYIIKLI